jgi:hypothetical protein
MLQKMIGLIAKRNQSTQRVDDMANGMATAALGRRLDHMLAMHASQPAPPLRHFETLTVPEPNSAKV